MVVEHYFDYAATTPLDARVAEVMSHCLSTVFGNPASTHAWGIAAKACVDRAKQQLAACVECGTDDLIFTSNATESINFALKGAFLAQNEKKQIISFSNEHRATLGCLEGLKKLGAEITLLPVDQNGLIDENMLAAAITPNTLLISVMHVNNEVGVVQNVQKIATLAAEKGVLCHIDAAQSLGKVPFSLKTIPASMVTFSAHKMYGPKGIGALYVQRRPRVNLFPLLHGGGAVRGLRAGTLATHQIVGFGEAAALLAEAADHAKALACQNAFLQALGDLPVHIHAKGATRVPHILNLHIEGVDNRVLFEQLPQYAFSKGSACTARMESPSHALLAMGVMSEVAGQSIRVSFGRFSTEEASHAFGKALYHVARRC